MLPLSVLVLILSVVGIALFSALRVAIAASNKARLKALANNHHGRAKKVLFLVDNFTTAIAAIKGISTFLTLITSVIIGSALSHFFTKAASIHEIWGNALVLLLVALGIAFLTPPFVFITQELPTRLAMRNIDKAALRLTAFLYPIIKLLIPTAKKMVELRRANFESYEDKLINEASALEEFKFLLKQKASDGTIEEAESHIMERVIGLGDRKLVSFMTPRPELEWLDLESPSELLREKISSAKFSHFPIAHKSLDNLVGTVHVRDLLCKTTCNELNLIPLAKPPLFVSESTSIFRLLEIFRKTGYHIAFIIDEYGSIQGLLTLSDIFRAIVGDWHPATVLASHTQSLKTGNCIVDGLMPIQEFKTFLSVDSLFEEEKAGYQTVGGFVQCCLGRIPNAGDTFSWNGFDMKVDSMEGNRVKELLVLQPNL